MFLTQFFTVFHHLENTLCQSLEKKRKYSLEKPARRGVSLENIFFLSLEIAPMCFLRGEKQWKKVPKTPPRYEKGYFRSSRYEKSFSCHMTRKTFFGTCSILQFIVTEKSFFLLTSEKSCSTLDMCFSSFSTLPLLLSKNNFDSRVEKNALELRFAPLSSIFFPLSNQNCSSRAKVGRVEKAEKHMPRVEKDHFKKISSFVRKFRGGVGFSEEMLFVTEETR